MRVEIYSDVICPWCYIGERRFARALEEFEGSEEVDVVFRPFQLDPGAPAAAVPVREYLRRKYGGSVESMMEHARSAARAEGLEFDFERALAANTRDAHRLMGLAESEHGPETQRALAERLFAAHFTSGADVSDRELLVRLATEVGMDGSSVRLYLAEEEGAEELEAQLAEAAEMGITAVPSFVFEGRYLVQGAQPPAGFLQVLERLKAEGAGEVR
jgi:predicted DsbA family dithiol-disulfide isomerase